MSLLRLNVPMQDCEILRLDDNYRGELFPRELDNSALTVFMNVSILAFPKVRVIMVVGIQNYKLVLNRSTPWSFITRRTLFLQ